jgi:hypothetical protein
VEHTRDWALDQLQAAAISPRLLHASGCPVLHPLWHLQAATAGGSTTGCWRWRVCCPQQRVPCPFTHLAVTLHTSNPLARNTPSHAPWM